MLEADYGSVPLSDSSIVANAFEANFRFDAPLPDVDFFEAKGVTSGLRRYEVLGKIAGEIQRVEKAVFVPFTPSSKDSYLVGFLRNRPARGNFVIDGIDVSWIGKHPIKNYPPGYRALTQYLNKSKATELRAQYWSTSPHTFFPRTWLDLKGIYPGCRFNLFRGPDFRYEVASDGRIIVVIDSHTHFIRAESFLHEVRRRGVDLEWLKTEIKKERLAYQSKRRRFNGVRFFYTLARNQAIIDDIDPRPISKIPLPQPQTISGVKCGTVAELIKQKYRHVRDIQFLDETQPGVKGGEFTYAPQFLRRSAGLDEVDNFIKNEQSHHIDTRPQEQKDRDRPAKERSRLFTQYFNQHFRYASLGPVSIRFESQLEFPATNNFEKPKLQTKKGGPPVSFEDLSSALVNGPYEDPGIKQIYVYNESGSVNEDTLSQFYGGFVDCAKNRFGIRLPSSFIQLDSNLTESENYLRKAHGLNQPSNSLCLSVLEPNSDSYDRLLSILGKYGIPAQGALTNTVREVCQRRRMSVLEGIVAGAISKSGGIPWILHDGLHYSCYAAVDVGRQQATAWAFSIVYDRRGRFATRPGALMVGEDLEGGSLRQCIKEAEHYSVDKDSFILLRDGQVFPSEWSIFEEETKRGPFSHCAIVSLKKDTPYRVLRKSDGEVFGPMSGDYYPLDANSQVLCFAGVDEYDHGLAKPLRVEIMTSKGKIDPELLGEDAFYLSYLNWGSPRHSYSTPAPVRLAHSMASDLSAGIIRAGQPF